MTEQCLKIKDNPRRIANWREWFDLWMEQCRMDEEKGIHYPDELTEELQGIEDGSASLMVWLDSVIETECNISDLEVPEWKEYLWGQLEMNVRLEFGGDPDVAVGRIVRRR